MGGAQILSTPRGGSSLGPSSGTAALSEVMASTGSVTLADQRLVEVGEVLAPLLPDGGLRRGAVVGVGGTAGASSLALALVAEATRGGAWVAAVGLRSLGLVAAAQLGVALERLVLVPDPGAQWPVVTAALLDSVEVVLLLPSGRVGATDVRRLTARARERGAVLVAVGSGSGARWPERPDLTLTAVAATWDGLGSGAGHLRSRSVEVVVSGRRAAARPRTWQVLLPGPDGRVAVGPDGRVAVGPDGRVAVGVAPAPAPAPVALTSLAV